MKPSNKGIMRRTPFRECCTVYPAPSLWRWASRDPTPPKSDPASKRAMWLSPRPLNPKSPARAPPTRSVRSAEALGVPVVEAVDEVEAVEADAEAVDLYYLTNAPG